MSGQNPVRRAAMRLGHDDSWFVRPLASLENELEIDASSHFRR